MATPQEEAAEVSQLLDAFVDRHLWHAYGVPVTQEWLDDLNRSLNTNYTLRFMKEFVREHIRLAFEELGNPWDEGHPLKPLYTLAQEDGYELSCRVFEEVRKDIIERKLIDTTDVFDDSDGGAVKHGFNTTDTGARRRVDIGRDCTATDGPTVITKIEDTSEDFTCLIDEDQLVTEGSEVAEERGSQEPRRWRHVVDGVEGEKVDEIDLINYTEEVDTQPDTCIENPLTYEPIRLRKPSRDFYFRATIKIRILPYIFLRDKNWPSNGNPGGIVTRIYHEWI